MTSKFAEWTRSSELLVKFTRTCHCQRPVPTPLQLPLPAWAAWQAAREAALSIRVTIMIRFVRMALPVATGMGPLASPSKVPAGRQQPPPRFRVPPYQVHFWGTSGPGLTGKCHRQTPRPLAYAGPGHNPANRGLCVCSPAAGACQWAEPRSAAAGQRQADGPCPVT